MFIIVYLNTIAFDVMEKNQTKIKQNKIVSLIGILVSIFIDWCITSTITTFQLYCGENHLKFHFFLICHNVLKSNSYNEA